MENDNRYTLVKYAVATDGGSIALCLYEPDGGEYWLILDRDMDSETYGRLFTSRGTGTPLTPEDERLLLPLLQGTVVEVEGDDGVGRELLDEVIKTISRRC